MLNTTISKTERIHIRVTSEQRKQLKRTAELSQKSLSEYLISAGLATNLDSAKTDFYHGINSELKAIKKSQYAITKLLLLVGSNQLNSEDKIQQFYEEAVDEFENEFGKD